MDAQLASGTSHIVFAPNDPSTNKTKFTVTATYKVTTTDTNLEGEKSDVENVVTNDCEVALEDGKQYNFHVVLGLTSVKLEVEVLDWEDATGTPAEVDVPNNTETKLYVVIPSTTTQTNYTVVNVTASGATLTINAMDESNTAIASPAITIGSSDTWITNSSGILTINANSGTAREGTVTVTDTGKGSHVFIIKQAGS